MGENILNFYKIPGLVQIDLMKVMMRDYKLSSFKLDNVISNFIKTLGMRIWHDEFPGSIQEMYEKEGQEEWNQHC